jgi:sigma-54-specific transcriptional regulator
MLSCLAVRTWLHRLWRQAWQALLNSDHRIAFEHMVLQLAEDAWRHNLCNQVRTAKQLNISRNILRTYLKKADLL